MLVIEEQIFDVADGAVHRGEPGSFELRGAEEHRQTSVQGKCRRHMPCSTGGVSTAIRGLATFLVVIVILSAGCRRSSPEAPRTEPPAGVPVVVTTATEKPMPVDVTTVGNVVPVTSVTVRSR
ncbi:MAG TPA: hypothetical protein VHZ49_08905, partial [Methylomirabilota bacterium]|nr:hypothetical protein [Methylomirabilota bacterium]